MSDDSEGDAELIARMADIDKNIKDLWKEIG